MALDEKLRATRERTVREHMDSEDRHDFAATLATFHHPRYELIATGEVYDGPEEVTRYYDEIHTAFPDAHNDVLAVHHSDDTVVVEATLKGTNSGAFRGLPPTGREIAVQGASIFVFEEDRLVCERIYFDSVTMLRQLGLAP